MKARSGCSVGEFLGATLVFLFLLFVASIICLGGVAVLGAMYPNEPRPVTAQPEALVEPTPPPPQPVTRTPPPPPALVAPSISTFLPTTAEYQAPEPGYYLRLHGARVFVWTVGRPPLNLYGYCDRNGAVWYQDWPETPVEGR